MGALKKNTFFAGFSAIMTYSEASFEESAPIDLHDPEGIQEGTSDDSSKVLDQRKSAFSSRRGQEDNFNHRCLARREIVEDCENAKKGVLKGKRGYQCQGAKRSTASFSRSSINGFTKKSVLLVEFGA